MCESYCPKIINSSEEVLVQVGRVSSRFLTVKTMQRIVFIIRIDDKQQLADALAGSPLALSSITDNEEWTLMVLERQ
jgi:hypothetical protein